MDCAPDLDFDYTAWAKAREENREAVTKAIADAPKLERPWYRVLFRKYGITPQQHQQLLHNQNGTCAICGGVNRGGDRLVVDHDHQTGKIRGLLCHSCNIGLGNFRDSRNVLQKAMTYLQVGS